jgi:hypothetical protein
MRRITLVVALVVSITLAGCAESQRHRAQRLEPMLSAAGFLVVLPDTPAKADELNSMTPLKMRYFSQGGKVHYWFADPVVCHCLFVGNEKAYQRYQQIKLQERMQQQAAETAMLNEDAAEQEQMNMTAWPVAPYLY